MILQEAIEKQVDIQCDSMKERRAVEKILKSSGVELWDEFSKHNLTISLYNSRRYDVVSGSDIGITVIPATAFITSNTK